MPLVVPHATLETTKMKVPVNNVLTVVQHAAVRIIVSLASQISLWLQTLVIQLAHILCF